MSHGVNPFTRTKFDYENPEHLAWARDGLTMPRYEKDADRLAEGIASSGIVHKIPGWGQLSKYMADLTWDHIGGLKIDTAEKLMKFYEKNKAALEKEAGHELTTDDLRKHVAREVNKLYGGEDLVRAGRNPTINHALQLLMLAPDFTKTTLQAIGSGVKGLTGSKAYRPQGVALAASALAIYAASRAMNRMLNDGDDKADVAPFGIALGNRVYTMRSLPQDAMTMMGDFRRFVANRMNPTTLKPVTEYLSGRNYRGEEITTPDILKETALSALPMSFRSLPGISQLTQTSRNNPVSTWEQLMSGLGIHASRHTVTQEASKVAGEFSKAAGKPSVPYPTSAYTPLKNALADNNWEKAQEEVIGLVKKIRNENPGMSNEEIQKKLQSGFHSSTFHLWTGDDSVEEKMWRNATPEQRAKLYAGELERRALWHKFSSLTGLGGSIKAETPKPRSMRAA